MYVFSILTLSASNLLSVGIELGKHLLSIQIGPSDFISYCEESHKALLLFLSNIHFCFLF